MSIGLRNEMEMWEFPPIKAESLSPYLSPPLRSLSNLEEDSCDELFAFQLEQNSEPIEETEHFDDPVQS